MDKCESGGNSLYPDVSQICESENVSDLKIYDSKSEPRIPNGLNGGECILNPDSTHSETSDYHQYFVLNGEQSDGETELKKDLLSIQHIEKYDLDLPDTDGNKSKYSPNISAAMHTSTLEKRPEGNGNETNQIKFPTLDGTEMCTDEISKSLLQCDTNKSIVDTTVYDAIEKCLDFDEDLSSFQAFETHLMTKSAAELREVSVQTIPIVSCPNCKRQKDGLGSLTALCLEYPPYKKRKSADVEEYSKSESDADFFETDEHEEGTLDENLNRMSKSSDDQVVPQWQFEEVSTQDSSSNATKSVSCRSIRLGLSKHAKLQPLHRKSKSPAADSNDTFSKTLKYKFEL